MTGRHHNFSKELAQCYGRWRFATDKGRGKTPYGRYDQNLLGAMSECDGSNRYGPRMAKPLFWIFAAQMDKENSLQIRAIAVELALIITKSRGTSCGKYLLSLFWSCRWRAVLTTTFSADCWARGQALLWQASLAAAMARVQFLAVCLEPFATMSISADRVTNTARGQRRFI